MGERTPDEHGPGWLGLGWIGSGVLGGAALALLSGVAVGQLLSYVSDRTPDAEARPEIGPVAGAVLGMAALLPLGVLLGVTVGLVLRTLARSGRLTAPRSALVGVVGGVALVAAIAVFLGVVGDPAAAPGLPAATVVPACLVGAAGAGLALLMQRSAARLLAWPTSTSPPPR